ncbi:MAG: hypothetical protein U1F26_03900 [Lysobacterales bacterium]
MTWGKYAAVALVLAAAALWLMRWPPAAAPNAPTAPGTATNRGAETPPVAPAAERASAPVRGGDARPALAQLMALPSLKALLAATAGDGDPRQLELRQATMLSCLLAQDALTQRPWAQEPAARAALTAYYEGYCARISTDSPVYIELQREAARRNAELPARSSETDQMLDRILNRDVDADLIQHWLDRMVETPIPDEAYALASAAIDPDGPLAGELDVQTLRQVPNPRRYDIAWAVADLLACQNGPLCAPGRAHTLLACIDRFNCSPGASRLEIRRDATAPRDWRIAEHLARQIRARQARRPH